MQPFITKEAERQRKHFRPRFASADGVRAAMENNRFETPVTVKSGTAGTTQLLRTVREASDYLLNNWPGKRSPKHREKRRENHNGNRVNGLEETCRDCVS